ncbi:histidine kinase [Pseudoflavitalea sp. X16]|uniref:tetratricopeptide repeat-containing sensor histidine kinase n=1 Tax=Paraflavitalea devenefica TaxID=2716334 RepID=UPI0014239287|nr:histidine kinase [Paraflavitalea devenefica]NII26182.1 histidine kinase [Paraflavitalea devenefica]
MKHLCCFLLGAAIACQPSTPSANTLTDSLYQQVKTRIGLIKGYDQAPLLLKHLDTLITLSMRDHPEMTAYHRGYKGYVLAITGLPDSARLYLTSLHQLDTTTSQKDSVGFVNAMGYATLYRMEKKRDSALAAAIKAYQYSRNLGAEKRLSAIAYLCDMYMTIGEHASLRKFIDEGLSLDPVPAQKVLLLSYLAVVHERVGKPDSAMITFQQVVNLTPKDNLQLQAINLCNLANVKVKMGLYAAAMRDMRRAFDLFHTVGWVHDEAYYNMARLLVRMGQRERAIPYYDSAIARARKLQDFDQVDDFTMEVSELQAQQGNFRSAYAYAHQALNNVKIRDSVALKTKLFELETRMGVQLKDEQIQRLALIQAATQATSQKRVIIIIGLSLAVIMGAAIAILLFRRQRTQRQLSEFQLEQRLLRTQMEPHFIFNALSQLQALVHARQIEKSLAYLLQFSRLLRVILVNTRKGFVPLTDEIEALESYLHLQQLNLDGAFSYALDLYPDYAEDVIFVPPMVIQPFVENAFHHGIGTLPSGGIIQIHITKHGQAIHCRIEDNGPGLGQRNPRSQRPSLSTHNTRDRLALLQKQTGTPASLTITDKQAADQSGVIVELVIPYRLSPLGK